MEVYLELVKEKGKTTNIGLIDKLGRANYFGTEGYQILELGRHRKTDKKMRISGDLFYRFREILENPNLDTPKKIEKIEPLVKRMTNQVRAQGIEIYF